MKLDPIFLFVESLLERIEELDTTVQRALEAESAFLVQRDAARALADQLAFAIFPDTNDEAADEQDRDAALAAYEARDWK